MWIVVKIKKNCIFSNLKSSIKKILLSDPILYSPKIKQQNIVGNKFYQKNFYLLGNYIILFHEKFKNSAVSNKLKFVKGVDIVLSGFQSSQKDIQSFVEKCKLNEDQNGYLKQNFFLNKLKDNIRFSSGPFINFAINLIEVQKNKISVLAGKYKILVNKNKNLIISC
tara:strand:+ start:94 stop:594 length:501 start_codon:yes stop_codon:yes gene_type:complete